MAKLPSSFRQRNRTTRHFREQFARLPPEVAEAVRVACRLFDRDPSHHSLRLHRLDDNRKGHHAAGSFLSPRQCNIEQFTSSRTELTSGTGSAHTPNTRSSPAAKDRQLPLRSERAVTCHYGPAVFAYGRLRTQISTPTSAMATRPRMQIAATVDAFERRDLT